MLDFASYAKSERKLKYFWTLMLSDALTKQKCIFKKKKTLLKKKTKLFLGTWGGPSIIIRYLMDGTAVVFWIHFGYISDPISHTGAKFHILSKKSHVQNHTFQEINILKSNF